MTRIKTFSHISFILFYFFNLYSISLSAQTKTEILLPIDKLSSYIINLNNDPDLKYASWSFCLMNPETNEVLVSHEKDKSLVPASGMKVITTLSALSLLGSDYTYTTTIEHDSTIQNGILYGNLYITGSGDPTLGSNRIAGQQRFDTLVSDWATSIKNLGIYKIEGNIIADVSAFENYAVPGSWNWDDIGQYYGAGPYALNVFENTYTLFFSSTKTQCRVDSVYPKIDGLTIYNDVKVSGSSDNAFIYGAPDNYFRYVVGNIPASRKNYTVDGSMPDPPFFLASEFKKALEKQGIQCLSQPTTSIALDHLNVPLKQTRKTLLIHKSPKMSVIVQETDLHSINLYAEALLKTLGKEKLEDGSTTAGVQAVRNYWKDKGINLLGFNMEDGSGLSRLNVITTNQMCQFLNIATQQKYFEIFKEGLPISGKTGTLKSITDGTSAEGKIIAKSGSMSKVRSYSGYVICHNGDLLSFSIMINNYTCTSSEIKSKLETLMIRMAAL